MSHLYEITERIFSYKRPCIFRAVTGFYCPGCGGTRAFLALLRGDVLSSIIYHPLVIYLVFAFAFFLVRYVKVRVFEEDKEKALLPAWVYFTAVFIVIVNCVIKNAIIIRGRI